VVCLLGEEGLDDGKDLDGEATGEVSPDEDIGEWVCG